MQAKVSKGSLEELEEQRGKQSTYVLDRAAVVSNREASKQSQAQGTVKQSQAQGAGKLGKSRASRRIFSASLAWTLPGGDVD